MAADVDEQLFPPTRRNANVSTIIIVRQNVAWVRLAVLKPLHQVVDAFKQIRIQLDSLVVLVLRKHVREPVIGSRLVEVQQHEVFVLQNVANTLVNKVRRKDDIDIVGEVI